MPQTNKSLLAALAVVAGAGAGSAATLDANATAYALGNEGTSLVTVASPGTVMPTKVDLSFEDGAAISLDAIAYRPQTAELYGYDDNSDAVYLINRTTGETTRVVSEPGVTNDGDLGFDFNNVLDAARIVTGEDENVVFFPNKMPPTLEPKTELFYVAGDANAGRNPNVVMNAYTNAVPNATSTLQYVLDSDWNQLATLGNNAGTLSTVGTVRLDGMEFDFSEDGGFDILSFSEGDNTAYALLTSDGAQGLYEVPLFADASGFVNLTFLSAVTRDFGNLDGFAVAPSAVPLPAGIFGLAAAFGALAVVRRRRKTA